VSVQKMTKNVYCTIFSMEELALRRENAVMSL
jgi:hypothetical protein